MEENFLPVNGRQAFQFFSYIKPLLDGHRTVRQVTELVPKSQRRGLINIIKALRSAGMLYDAAMDMATEESIDGVLLPLIGRIETQSDQPFRVFSELQKTRVLVLSPQQMPASAIMEGLFNAGFLRLAWSSPDAAGADLANLTEPLSHHVHWPENGAWPELIDRFDIVVILSRSSDSREWMEPIVSSLRNRLPAVIPVIIHGQQILIGPVLESSSVRRLQDIFDRCWMEWPIADVPESTSCIADTMTAALLAQKLFDYRAGLLQPEDLTAVQHLDLSTLEIRRRPAPFPVKASQVLLANVQDAALSPSRQTATAALDITEFLQRVNKSLVDPATGLLLRLEEHNLYQVPQHQSAALWRLPGTQIPVWTSEAGPDIAQSRFAVACTVFEEYLSAVVQENVQPSFSLNPSLHSENDHSHSKQGNGVVVSAADEESLNAHAYFRALARHAHGLKEWTPVPFHPALIQGEAELFIGYFNDVGAMQDIQVECCSGLIPQGCQILRFSYQDRPISVIAGPLGHKCWEAGLRDIWLEMTARKDLGEKANLFPFVRFRCAPEPAPILLRAKSELPLPSGLEFVSTALQWPELGRLDPLIFTLAAVSVTPHASR